MLCILAAVICKLSITMHASRASAMKRTDKLANGTECKGCGKTLGSMFSYDQHQRNPFLRGIACYAMPDENGTTTCPPVQYSADRPSAREVEDVHIKHFLSENHMSHIKTFSKQAYTRGVGSF